MQFLVKIKRLTSLTFIQLRHRNSGPTRNDLRDLFFGHALMNQRHIFVFYLLFFRFQLLLKLWQASILKLSRLVQIILLLSRLDFPVDLFNLFTKFLHGFNGTLLIVPLGFSLCELLPVFRQILLQMLQSLLT